MSPVLVYFLKVNIAFMIFYAFYRLFFYEDTFFKLRRSILLVFFGLAFIYPLMDFREWLMEKEPIVGVVYLYSTILQEMVVEGEASLATDWDKLFGIIVSRVFWLTAGLLLVRFFVRLGSIIWLTLKSRQAIIQNTNVHLLDKPSGPFSFFRLIFVYPESHSEKELDEILAHEKTHVSQWHSVDVIIGEIVCIICWMNPFIWLLKREMRHNLEYLADNTVLMSGYDSKSYQYHLLGLAHYKNQAAANLYNNFNVLHLKNRISMMNKKRSRSIGRTKYLIFIPLVAILMLLSNIEAVARITKNLATNIQMEEPVPITVGLKVNLGPEHTKVNQGKDKPLTVVEVMPQFPGGEGELLKFLSKNIKYPVDAQQKGIEGRVIVAFVVNKNGTISDAEIVRGVSPSLDTEALRVIDGMPAWTPGREKGEVVAVKYTVPIAFRLKDSNKVGKKTGTPPENSIYDNSDPKNPVYRIVDIMPQFPGGEGELLKFIASNTKYPMDAQQKGIQGRVIAGFIVEADGTISNCDIFRGISESLDKEAIRVISIMPKWTPGKKDGKNVRVHFVVPITFHLSKMGK
ncbi:MAG: M56 family metallopeptidase [Tannerellaceae bacterium]|jgi:TonB family protein|nr:M56 family metallopeptidase [Tannerellaceae bacterium]